MFKSWTLWRSRQPRIHSKSLHRWKSQVLVIQSRLTQRCRHPRLRLYPKVMIWPKLLLRSNYSRPLTKKRIRSSLRCTTKAQTCSNTTSTGSGRWTQSASNCSWWSSISRRRTVARSLSECAVIRLYKKWVSAPIRTQMWLHSAWVDARARVRIWTSKTVL